MSRALFPLFLLGSVLLGQDSPPETKRLFGIVPNFRTSPTFQDYKPLTPAAKFKLASQDSFDRGTMGLAAIVGGIGLASNSDPSFGHGIKGYGHYFITSYADFVVGDYMTEAVFPTLLHQDPRYFRKGTGSAGKRLAYAVGQIFLTHGDNGHRQVNYSEILGNSVAVAISTSWYPDSRTASDGVVKLGTQLGFDAGSNVLKEFWPEISRLISRKKK